MYFGSKYTKSATKQNVDPMEFEMYVHESEVDELDFRSAVNAVWESGGHTARALLAPFIMPVLTKSQFQTTFALMFIRTNPFQIRYDTLFSLV